MSRSLASYPAVQRAQIARHRLEQGERRKIQGLGYWAAKAFEKFRGSKS